MKMKNNKFINYRGFTLVELLVVIAIIAVVASISIPVGTRLVNSARATESKGQMKQTIEAFRMFKEDHHSISYGVNILGLAASTTTADDPDVGGDLRATMRHNIIYRSVDGNRRNRSNTFSRTKKNYFKTATTKDADKASIRGGIARNSSNEAVGMLDPWGRAYFSVLDESLKGTVVTDFTILGSLDGKTAEIGNDVYFLMSRGADGLWDTNDDIMSHQLR